MRNRTSSAGRQHQLVLSVAPHCLIILHFQRGLMGWKRAHQKNLTLLEGDDYLDQIQKGISQCSIEWKLPVGIFAYWILASDILGILPPAPGEGNASTALPFSTNDTRVQPDTFSSPQQPSLMWIHKDWVAEIERISSHCQLQLAEIFARAQIFQRYIAKLPKHLKIVIEHAENLHFLHIFSATGMMLRTRILENAELSLLHSVLLTEISGLNFDTNFDRNKSFYIAAPAALVKDVPAWPGFERHALEKLTQEELMEELWRSDIEGITVRSTHEAVIKNIVVLSICMAIGGFFGLGLMSWHNNQLKQQIDEGRAQARADLHKVESAKKLKARTLQLADAVNAIKSSHENNGAMTAFTQILANFPPAPATLLYVRTNEKSLEFAGLGDGESVKWLQERSFPGYEPLRQSAVPDFLQSSNPSIHFQSQKLASSATTVDATASSTAVAASRTATP